MRLGDVSGSHIFADDPSRCGNVTWRFSSENKVLLQLLVEAVVLSAAGGLIGIALGIGGSLALASAMGWPFVLTPLWIFVASRQRRKPPSPRDISLR